MTVDRRFVDASGILLLTLGLRLRPLPLLVEMLPRGIWPSEPLGTIGLKFVGVGGTARDSASLR